MASAAVQADRVVAREAAAEGVDAWPLSLHVLRDYPRRAVLLGFAGLRPEEIRRGVVGLRRVVQRARRSAGR